jgi:radical SAM superfamily enzyme YgiQ (UPF0313 family)
MFIENQIKMPWGCELRVDAIKRDDAELLKKAGIESASEEVLKRNFKYQDPTLVLKGLDFLKEQNISVQCYFILGLPGETDETFQETVKYIKNLPLTNEDTLEFFVATPYPGSLLWENKNKYKIKIIETDFSKYDCQHIIFETQSLNTNQLRKMFNIAKELEKYHLSK